MGICGTVAYYKYQVMPYSSTTVRTYIVVIRYARTVYSASTSNTGMCELSRILRTLYRGITVPGIIYLDILEKLWYGYRDYTI